MSRYIALVDGKAGAYGVVVPDLPGCTSGGRTTDEALRNAVDRLQTSPRAFGEPLYRLPALRMQVRCGALGPLSIDFGVCDDRPLVFIMAVKLLSGKGS